jgi:hypothetical protein
MKKFYIVNDYKDLLSGKVIPRKVLDHLPISTFAPMVHPMPIKKYTGLSLSPTSPGLSSFSPVMPIIDPYNQLSPMSPTVSISPWGPETLGPAIGLNMLNSPLAINRPMAINTFGPPIIKLSPLISQNIPGTIKIISDTNVFTLNVPYQNLRQVVNYIYLNANDKIDQTKPKITFRIITPTIDSSITTTFDKMIDIVNHINKNYTNITYIAPNGRQSDMGLLLATLSNLVDNLKIK